MASFLTYPALRSHVFSAVKSTKPDRFQYELILSSRFPSWNGLFLFHEVVWTCTGKYPLKNQSAGFFPGICWNEF